MMYKFNFIHVFIKDKFLALNYDYIRHQMYYNFSLIMVLT